MTPLISIDRHKAGLYEWKTIWGAEEFDGEIGDNSIQGCLIDAIDRMPESQKLVEISYRGIHMGTFHAVEVRELTEDVAERIVASYAAFIDSVS